MHDSVFIMQCAMGRTKSRIGRFPKNYEKHLVQKRVGRPAKKKLRTPTDVSVTALSDLIDSPLPSNRWIIQNHLPDMEQPVEEMITLLSTNFATTPYH